MSRRVWLSLLTTGLLAGLLPVAATAAPPADRPGKKPKPVVVSDAPLVFAPQGLSQDRFAVAAAERVDVRARDGVQLHARVFRPDTSSDPGWRTPVILVHSPYYDGALLGSATRSLDLVEFFTPKGYTVVLSDVRGTGNSGGCGSQDGADQAEDFALLVEHFAAQPWSNGKVGSYGKSYDAETQHAGAVLAPQGLETMVSVAGISGLYDVAYFDGVPLRTNGVLSAAAYELYDLDVPSDATYLPRRAERHTCQPANFVNGADPRGDLNPYWAEREFRSKVQRVQASTLYVMGLSDFTVAPIAIDGWYDELAGHKRAIFGQWGHFYPYDAPAQFARDDWYDAVHAWLDAELLDLPTGTSSWPNVQVQSEAGDWRAVPSFAGMGTAQELPLASDGVLGGTAEGTRSFLENGSLAWTTPVLEQPTQVSGQLSLDATISLDRPDAHFAMTLQEVRANGTVRTLTRGYLSAPHRTGLATPTLVPLLTPVDYTLRSYPFDKTVAAGSSIRLLLGGFDGSTTPAGTLFTATVGAASLSLPVVTRPCGVEVATREQPRTATASCPGQVVGD